MATAAAHILILSIKLLLLSTSIPAAATYDHPVVPSPAGTINRSFYLNNHPRHKMWSSGSLATSARYEGSSDLIQLRYHMGPVLSSPLSLYLLWYGRWDPTHQSTIRDFLLSISDPSVPPPSAHQWWSSTAALYTDQTGANITRQIVVAAEASLDPDHSPQGRSLTRLTVQNVLADAIQQRLLPVDQKSGAYLLLTSPDITVQDFCRAACGFHYFTFPSIVGHTLPYAWVGNSAAQCPETCAYPFAVPGYMAGATSAMLPPNGDVGIDGMVSVVGHELAELSSNPLVNAWYAGEDPTAPTEIADLCEGVYGTGGGGGYTGEVSTDGKGRKYNINGRNGRRFLVQWIWSPVLKACSGPNAMD